MNFSRKVVASLLLILVVLPSIIYAEECINDSENEEHNKPEALKFKIIALVSILIAGAIGVCLPMLGKIIPALSPEKNIFFLVKAFAAGVILATGFIHVLTDANENLTSPCLKEHPWGDFPFAYLVAMFTAIINLFIDTVASFYFSRTHSCGNKDDVEKDGGHVHVHTHATDGHAHGHASFVDSKTTETIRHKIVSQVLELGIVVHSVIIGLSLGASQSLDTIKPLVVALTFHQFFEGMGLGGCISQANFKNKAIVIMIVFFSLTTPFGIAIGIGISDVYKENSPTPLIVEGLLNAASAGILIYMALVDLLSADFRNPKMQSNFALLLGCFASLIMGVGLMSILALWA